MDIDDDIIRLRNELEDDIEHIHREMGRDKDMHVRNLDRRLDSIWSEIHKNHKFVLTLDKIVNPNKELLNS